MRVLSRLVRLFKERGPGNAAGKLAPAHAAAGGEAPASTLFLRSSFALENKGGSFKIRVARRTSVLEDALGLLNRRYLQRGYGGQTLTLSKQRMTIVAYEGRRVMGTLTVQLDAGLGLLGDECFRPELDALRSQSASLCEFIKLATAPDAPMPATLASMFHVAFIFAHQIHAATHAAIEVNPRHAAFYRRVLGFSPCGAQKENARVNAPAVLLVVGFRHIGEQLNARDAPAAAAGGPPGFFSHSFSNQEADGIRRRMQAALGTPPAPAKTIARR